MPDRDSEVFSNPLPPSHHRHEEEDDSHPLTNDDFRKMMMTPKVSRLGGSYTSTTHETSAADRSTDAIDDEDDAATRRKKKKNYYAKLKKEEEDRKKELASKYRDRALERRHGSNNDYAETEIVSTTADYRAVAPDAKAEENYAERRKQMIQESKYLGGDMEHTHLVKGLDYALLEKVRAEISYKELEEEEVMEAVVSKKDEEHPEKPEPDPEEQIQFKTKMARNVYRIVFKNKLPERNELFLPRRMAYVVDLEDEFADSDVPTTFIRSKADCPTLEASTTLTTNDIVINKLTQILSYLRQGRRDNKKLKKKDKGKLKDDDKPRGKTTGADDGIYDDIGQYQPSLNKIKDKKEGRDREHDRGERDYRDREDRDRDRKRDRDRRDRGDRVRDERDNRDNRDRENRDRRDRDRDRDRGRDGRDRERDREMGRDRDRSNRDRPDRNREKDRDREPRDREPREVRKPYFEKPVEEDEDQQKQTQSARELVQSINEKYKSYGGMEDEKSKGGKESDDRIKKLKAKTEIDSYAECYPGLMESYDAFDDSDEDADYTKMDQGNKKGPVGRWDFDTQEEYSSYMSNKEAMPKAAFQYGVKMADGRRTRRTGPKDEKTKLDRELQQIQRIIDKRKVSDGGSGSKKPKY
ncbi:protein Red [Patella vulgata]|uniref:protein Red n=1 Tax=Patella vulgata TaxID=6465 RepID=UPI0021806FB0|nr:protein Red [Patella vulgata]